MYAKQYYWPKHLEPGTNYTIRIVVYCWGFESYRKSSSYNGYIQTQRKYNTSVSSLLNIRNKLKSINNITARHNNYFHVCSRGITSVSNTEYCIKVNNTCWHLT